MFVIKYSLWVTEYKLLHLTFGKYNLNLLSWDLKKIMELILHRLQEGSYLNQGNLSTYLIICLFTFFIILGKKEIVFTVINVVTTDTSSRKIT